MGSLARHRRLPGNRPLSARDPFELIEEADNLLRESVHILCLTEDQPSRGDHLRYGTGPRRARMWAQYAKNHTGLCLCFDGQRLIDAAHDQLKAPGRSLMNEPVRYAQEGEDPFKPVIIQPQAERDLRAFIESMVDKHPRELFFTKDWDWSSETEYRFLLRGDTEDEEFIDIRGALEAVIAGQRFHPVYRPGLYKLCQELDVKPFVIQWQMGPPCVVAMPDPGNRPLTDPVRCGGD